MKKILILILTFLLLISGCQSNKYEKRQQVYTTLGFNTQFQFIAYTTTQAEFDKYSNKLKEQFTKYHQLFSTFDDYSNLNNIKTINDKAGKEKVKVDPIIIELLLLAKEAYEFTNHKFDITMGNTLSIWHEYREEGIILNEKNLPGKVPSKDALDFSKQYRGWKHIQIDKNNNTVYIDDKNVSLDVGGIAKGFATEKVAQELENMGLKYGLISAGGNVRTINTKSDNTPWAIGIEEPTLVGGNSLFAYQYPGTISFVTSGDYQRFYEDFQNKRYHHLIDPETNWPAYHYRFVNIMIKDSAWADIISTTLFLSSIEDGQKIIEKLKTKFNDEHIGATWCVDKTNKYYQDARFKSINETYKIFNTENMNQYKK